MLKFCKPHQRVSSTGKNDIHGAKLPVVNALTVDVEDYFQVTAFDHVVSRHAWGRFESRVERNTRRLIEIFAACGVRATFFILGWVAKHYPHLVMEIAEAGHELASHGFWHHQIHNMTPAEFREDLRHSRDAIEQAGGVAVTAYRAPSFSVTQRSLWALEILVEQGFVIDSSIFPVRHDRYGMRRAVVAPHEVNTPAGLLTEFPPSIWQIASFRLPIAGGGYFRLYPLTLTFRGLSATNACSCPYMFYLHPWEIDPHQPPMHAIGWRTRFRHYVGLQRTESKLIKLLEAVQFDTLSASLEAYRDRHVLETVSYQ